MFRTNLAEFLTRGYKSKVEASDLVLNAGATNGIHLILTTLVDLNGFVFLDEGWVLLSLCVLLINKPNILYLSVTYMIALEAISQFSSIKIVPVKLNDDGVDIKDLEEKLKARQFESNGKLFWGVYYTMPTFHNPTGILFSNGTFWYILISRILECTD